MEISSIKIIQIIVLQCLFLAFYQWYLSKEVDYQFARLYLLLTLIFSLAIPFISMPIPDDVGKISTYLLPEISVAEFNQLTTNLFHFSIDQLLIGIYFLFVVIAGLKLASSLIRIITIVLTEPIVTQRNYYLIHTSKVATSSFGPILFWNPQSGLSQEEQALIRQHEESHIKGWHSLDIIIAECMTVLMWFNPLVYLYKNAIAQNHEFIADQYSAYSKKKTYAELLLKSALEVPGLSFTSHFSQINTNKRIMELTKSIKRNNRPIHYCMLLFTLGLAVVFVSFTSPAQAQQLAHASDQSDDKVYFEVDQLPSYKGGMKALISELQRTLVYPDEAKKIGTEGMVMVSFVVTKAGEVTKVGVEKSLTKLCDEAAVAAVSQLPPWNPGMHEGQVVNVRLVLPINFELDDAKEGQ